MSDSKYGRLYTEADVRAIALDAACTAMDDVGDRNAGSIADEAVENAAVTFPPDEPLFLLRAQDELATKGIDAYGLACYTDARVHEDHARAVAKASRLMSEWQCANPDRTQVPD